VYPDWVFARDTVTIDGTVFNVEDALVSNPDYEQKPFLCAQLDGQTVYGVRKRRGAGRGTGARDVAWHQVLPVGFGSLPVQQNLLHEFPSSSGLSSRGGNFATHGNLGWIDGSTSAPDMNVRTTSS
jgi:hypothetical protein